MEVRHDGVDDNSAVGPSYLDSVRAPLPVVPSVDIEPHLRQRPAACTATHDPVCVVLSIFRRKCFALRRYGEVSFEFGIQTTQIGLKALIVKKLERGESGSMMAVDHLGRRSETSSAI